MDPISITGTAIALAQASGAIGKALKFLYSLKDIPSEFVELKKELAILQAILEQIENALKILNDEFSGSHTLLVGLNIMALLGDDLGKAVNELDSLCRRLQDAAGGLDRAGHPRISKRVWLQEKNKIAKIKARASATRERLTLCFVTLNSTQNSRQTDSIMGLKTLLEGTSKIVSQTLSAAQASQSSVDKTEETLAQIHTTLRPSTRPFPAPSQSGVAISESSGEIVLNNSKWTELATVGQRCSTYCKCRCHQHVRIQTPQWIRSVFGSLFVEYDYLPLLDPRDCDSPTCQTLGLRSVRFDYAFPKWLLARAVCLAVSWNILAGVYSNAYLSIPRVLNANVLVAIRENDLSWFKRAISTRSILPEDTDHHGGGLIAEAIRVCKIELAIHLFQKGFSTQPIDKYGRTAATFARYRLFKGQNLSPQEYSFLWNISLKFRPGRRHQLLSTVVHDSLLGLGHIPLSSAIASTPSDVNRLDDTGWSPMHWAIWRKDSQALEMMLASPESNPNVRDATGRTLLHLAAGYETADSAKMTQLLIDAGADVKDAAGILGFPPISVAFGNPAVLQVLLEHGADATYDDEDGQCTPLMDFATDEYDIADRTYYRHRWGKSLELLLSVGVDLDLPLPGGGTALHHSISRRNRALLRLLLRYGASTAAVDENGSGILHYAAQHADLEMVNILREASIKGMKPDAPDDDGQSPMKIMMGRLCDFDDPNRPPGIYAATYGELLAFKSLLDEIKLRNINEQPLRGVDEGNETPSNASEAAVGGSTALSQDLEGFSMDSNLGLDDEESEEEFFDAVETF